MPHYVTESIWHFIGYMHLTELLSKAPLQYSGASIYTLQSIDRTPFSPVAYAFPKVPAEAGESASVEVALPPEQRLIFRGEPLTIDPAPIPLDGVVLELPTVHPPLDLSTVLPGAARVVSEITVSESGDGGLRRDSETVATTVTLAGEAPPPPKISATYTVGESQLSDIHIAQVNALLDTDILRGDPVALIEAGLAPAKLHALGEGSAELAELVQKAIDLLPSNAVDGSPADGIDRMRATDDGELEIGLPAESDVVAEAVEPGRYVNGERVGDAGSSAEVIEAQIAKVEAAMEEVTPVDHGPVETQTSSDGPLHIVTGSEPTGGPAHAAIAGGNDLVNAAVLYDLADAAGSMIVRGDVHLTDAIVQVNVLQDNDTVNATGADALSATLSGTALLEAAIAQNGAGGGNTTTNEAAFVHETGPIYGNVALGGVPGALNWQVDYVQGSFFDLTTVQQYNVLIDTDAAEQTTTGTHFVATLGENGAVNLLQLSELGASYDLIIVAGDYHEVNAIVQANVLLDDDSVDQAAGDPAATQWIDADGNTLANDAAIVRVGGDSYKPLTGEPEALADAVGSMQAELDYSLATGLPGNGTDTLKVLYITGDYYNYNVLMQTSVADDSDQIVQATADEPALAAVPGDSAEEPDALAQTAAAGGNTAQNVALLVSVDSTSDYQYVGGEVYEDALLVQGEIVVDEDEGNATDLHPDVVAAIAALSGSSDEAAPAGDLAVDQPDTGASADVMGSILA